MKARTDQPAERICGYEFYRVAGKGGHVYDDLAACALCGDIVDVGAELRSHVAWHDELKAEQWEET